MKKPADLDIAGIAGHSSLEDWVDQVQRAASAPVAASGAGVGAERGACLVSDPAGGPAMCVFVDRETCRRIKGTFIGGPC